MRKKTYTILILLIAYLALVIYSNRALFTHLFDEAYWKDKYEHSQWKLPLSIRTIGDDGLYLYEGYRLIKGGNPTLLNAEVPPFGKYLIGLTILLIKNAFLYGMWTILLLLVGMFLLAKRLFRQTLLALGLTLLLATDPLITSQYALTMLDGIQTTTLVFFLIALFALPRATPKRQLLYVVTAGIVLGLFSETKAPVLSPIVALVALVYIWLATKHKAFLAWFVLATALGYFLPYLPYFLQGHTLIEWLRVQKWIASFYLHSTVTATWGSVLTTLLAGRFQNIFSRGWEAAPQWSPLWGLLLLAAAGGIYRIKTIGSAKREWGVIFSLLFLIIGLYAVVPFWTRYLTLILPLLYIAGAWIAIRLPTRLTYPLFAACLVINLVASAPLLVPSPRQTIHQFIHNAQYMFFADIYEDLSTTDKQKIERSAFRRFGLQTMIDGQIERIEIVPKSIPSGRTSPQILIATMTYFTRELGSFTQEVAIPFVLEDNRWRISWDWSYLLPGLTPATHLETTIVPARRGSILASDKSLLAHDSKSYLISILPGEIEQTREQELLLFFEVLFGPDKPAVHLHQRIHGNSLGDVAIPLGVVPRKLTQKEYDMLSSYKGVILTPHVARWKGKSDIITIGDTANSHFFECCSYLYSTTTYDGTTGVEQAKNNLLKGVNGGTLTLKNQQGITIRTYIKVTKSDGKNVEP